MSFQIDYHPPAGPAPEAPERFETYDVEDAFYDYLPRDIGATLRVDGYSLELTGLKFVTLLLNGLKLAENLRDLAEDGMSFREGEAPLPEGFRAYVLSFADFGAWYPVLVFAAEGEWAWIFTRTCDEAGSDQPVTLPVRDLADPVCVPRAEVIREIHDFMAVYLDELRGIFPFVVQDALYDRYRARLAALRKALS